ncbi:MAG: hypothetical protein V3S51_06720 [Dehalococcoidia bacterium]
MSNRPPTMNVGSRKAVSIGELSQKILKISGKAICPAYDHQKPTGPVGRTADIDRARSVLLWQPKIDLDTGLRSTYAWAENRLA